MTEYVIAHNQATHAIKINTITANNQRQALLRLVKKIYGIGTDDMEGWTVPEIIHYYREFYEIGLTKPTQPHAIPVAMPSLTRRIKTNH